MTQLESTPSPGDCVRCAGCRGLSLTPNTATEFAAPVLDGSPPAPDSATRVPRVRMEARRHTRAPRVLSTPPCAREPQQLRKETLSAATNALARARASPSTPARPSGYWLASLRPRNAID